VAKKLKVRGGRLSFGKVVFGVCTAGLSLPFTGVRQGGATEVVLPKGFGGTK
jgi:putative intracellular protease/amidase